MFSFFRKNYLFLIIIALGVFLRSYSLVERLDYAHDQDLQGWIIKDIVVNKHLRLVGQETSTQGIFIGPLYYYLLIPFYLVLNMDPIAGSYLALLLGILTIGSFYFVFKEVFNKTVGLVASFVYSVSFPLVFNDRSVVPTSPMLLWSVWFFYATFLLLRGNQKGFLLVGILAGLIWNINASLVLLLPIALIAFLLSEKRKINWRYLIFALVIFLIILAPLVVFEIRHGFIQSKSLIKAFTLNQGTTLTRIGQFEKVVFIISSGAVSIFFQPDRRYVFWIFLVYLISFIYLTYKGTLNSRLSVLMFFWVLFPLIFFSLYSKIVSEYYLNEVLIVWIAILSLTIFDLIKEDRFKIFAFVILLFFGIVNLNRSLSYQGALNGYKYRKALVSEIKKDALEKKYPCIAISYITDPGYNLGYRYLFWLENLHVNQPKSGSPVYTIVYPLNDKLFPVHRTFGALGLIYPDYRKYTQEQVEKSCLGENANLTDPMFGFTD